MTTLIITRKHSLTEALAIVDAIVAHGSFPTKTAQKDAMGRFSRMYEDNARQALLDACKANGETEAFWDAPHNLSQFGKKATSRFAAYPEQLNAIQTLRNAYDTLKALPVMKVVKKPAAPANPDKVVKTCACCFREIAVRNGTMVHHGYQRTGWGFQTDSCLGFHYPPLEVSDAGLRAMIEQLKNHIARCNTRLDNVEAATSLTKTLRGRKGAPGRNLVVTQDEPNFASLKTDMKREIQREKESTERTLDMFNEKLANWQQTEEAA